MRTFLWILVAFLALVGSLVASFAWQGRAAREYGLGAVRAAQQRGLSPTTPAGLNCAGLVNRPPPGPVERCVVRVENDRLAAILTLEGGRVFRVSP
ncbi:hypothetical protein [Deinococcus planocerae]|uniref:hypothetical protein n=1 Tax=Deinococcus planocerae TaxID=1737569 RepID=UPI000C7E97E5|nr:hypothetical protein [Deinococcus planocerae]